jgi:hypothetical protein
MKRQPTAEQKRALQSQLCGTVEHIMSEHVRMPGFPAIIVTRDFLYGFLIGCGWPRCERGFGSMDYMVFGREAVTEPLHDESERDYLLAQVRSGYLRRDVQ